MIYIKVKGNNVEKALRNLKRKVKDTGLFLELKNKEFYRKPSDIRREKKARAKTRAKWAKIKNNENSWLIFNRFPCFIYTYIYKYITAFSGNSM